MDDNPGMVTRMGLAFRQPFPADMTWQQLALVVGFIIIITAAWRQVINYIGSKV